MTTMGKIFYAIAGLFILSAALRIVVGLWFHFMY